MTQPTRTDAHPIILDDPTDQALADYLDGRRSDLTASCQQLLQTPSVNGVHPERLLAECIAEQARGLALDTAIVGVVAERPNVIVSTGTGTTGLLLLGHLDTVPAGDNWRYPPFGGEIHGGRLYGRGAVDTKGGMTAALFALAALRAVPGALRYGRAQFIGVPDEETGATGTLGIRFLAERGLLRGTGAIYAYSSNQMTLGHRGLVRYRIVCHGESVHTGSEAWQDGKAGANAVTAMAALLLALEALPTAWSSTRYFERFRTLITPGTIIRGGTSINIVPDTCEALVDVRTIPETDERAVSALLDGVMAQIAGERGVRFTRETLNVVPAAISDESAPIVMALDEAARLVRGTPPPRMVAGPANEGYLLIERGIPTICGYGPIGANAHAPDEYVEIASLYDTALIFALTARRLDAQLAS